ncbi:PTS system trehalose-specific EIIBC component [Fodinisporobacter ferrooxydans]|uniref:PTS system trehalose-specific EIIBC component n=1 Tax=Fodinisporobacter ferrooxydans TaxID=2901836 RepID=A0ABY4CIE6_9BACL|nr:PTS system trehalose-specific EIIBC component [Alicyclobacillaceae bacterium MYW30-H2]
MESAVLERNENKVCKNGEILYAPLSGRVFDIEQVPDPTFASKIMGEGMAIEPSKGEVVSPVNGKILHVFPTKHAVGILSESGLEILIHVGLETVALNGEGFTSHVKEGDLVKVGDLLLTFDLEYIQEKAASIITPIVITNGQVVESLAKNINIQAEQGKTEILNIQIKANLNSAQELKKSSVEQIVEAIGGKENVNAATHCVTRLRLALKDERKIDQTKLEAIDLVKGTFSANGQFQIVIGPGVVEKAYAEFIEITGAGQVSKEEMKSLAAEKLNPIQRFIKTLGDIFIPLLPAIITAGLLMGINNILSGPGIFYRHPDLAFIDVHPAWKDFADIINLIANTSFTFLPGLIGWSAVKRFGGSELLGIVLGLMLIHPELLNAWGYAAAVAKHAVPHWNLFGLQIQKIGYQGQVLPVLVSSYVLAKIERWIANRVPDGFKLLLVAPITLLITGFLSFIIIGPVTFAIGRGVTDVFMFVFNHFAWLGGLVYGALYSVLVITGMHHTFLAVDLQLIASTGSTFLWPILALSNISQGSAALAMMFANKHDEKLRGMALTSAISAYLGITEPAMFGVNIRFRFPFYSAMIGSAIAGFFITLYHVRATSIGVGGIPGFLSIFPNQWGPFFIGMAIALVVPFVLTLATAKAKKVDL